MREKKIATLYKQIVIILRGSDGRPGRRAPTATKSSEVEELEKEATKERKFKALAGKRIRFVERRRLLFPRARLGITALIKR